MDKLRQAAQQALEALEIYFDAYPHMQKGYVMDAIVDLRAAIEQALTPGEPYCYTYTENGEEFFAPPTAYVPDNAVPLYTAAPQPQPKQEPVAWGVHDQIALNKAIANHSTPAAPMQEPVAYRFKERPDDLRSAWRYVSKKQHVPHGWPYQSLSITGGNK